jgi:hypothetical protein
VIFPRRNLDVVTPMDARRVYDALAPFVAWDRRAPAPYLGRVWAGGFELRPNIRGRNSFIPFARGTVQPAAEGSRVVVTMRMGPITTVFMTIWLGMAFMFMALTVVMAAVTALHGESGGIGVFGALFLFASMFPVFGIGLSRYGFNKEAVPLERFLLDALQARPTPPYR